MNNSKKSILVIAFSPIAEDPRVMRQIRTLAKEHKVSVMGYGDKPQVDIDYIEINGLKPSISRKVLHAVLLLMRSFEIVYWRSPQVKKALEIISNRKFDLVIANDIPALPLALRIANDSPVLLDAHEYAPRQYEDRFIWRLFFKKYNEYLCRQYIGRVASMTTVCDGIADEYQSRYGIHPKVVYNSPGWQNLTPRPVKDGLVRMIHHGAYTPSRHLDLMVDVMRSLDERFQLDFMLINHDSPGAQKLKRMARDVGRIRFIPPVPMEQICAVINEYDIGIFLVPPTNFNLEHALPNKLFEFIQANLAVAIGKSPEMANIVRRYSCGVVADSYEPEDLARLINSLSDDDIYALKQASGIAAKDLNYERSAQVLVDEVCCLLR